MANTVESITSWIKEKKWEQQKQHTFIIFKTEESGFEFSFIKYVKETFKLKVILQSLLYHC